MLAFQRVPIIIWGHCTPLLQVADIYQNQALKQKYAELEALHVADYLEKRPNGNPRLTRTEILCMVAKAHNSLRSDRNFMAKTREQFYKTGTCVALDGSEDVLINSDLLPYWEAEGIPQWREQYVAATKPGSVGDVQALINTFENPHAPDIPVDEIFSGDDVVEDAPATGEQMEASAGGGHEGTTKSDNQKTAEVDATHYAIPRCRKKGGPDAEETQTSEAKRQKLVQQGVELAQHMPKAEDPWEVKRAYTLRMARYVEQLDLSPRYLKANRKYAAKRAAQGADLQKKAALLANHEAVAAKQQEEEREEEEKREKEFALQRRLSTQKGRGRKKKELTEDELNERKIKNRERAKQAYERKKKQKGGGGNLVGRDDTVEGGLSEPDNADPAEKGRLLAPYEPQPVPFECAQLCAVEDAGKESASSDSDWA